MSLNVKLEDIGDVEDFVVKASTNKCFMIVNNFENDPISDRRLIGYNVDSKKLEETLTHFNFEVTVERNLQKNKMVKAIKNFIMENDFDDDDCVVCCIFTHGLEHGGLCGIDEKSIAIEVIIHYFTAIKALAGKPKLFFIQACRGELHADAVETNIRTAGCEQRVEQSDVFVFYSTFEGYVAYVDDNHGSFFIQALCKVLQKYGGKHSLQKIATKVNDILSSYVMRDGKCQASEMRSSLTREVYLQTDGPMSDGTYPIYEDKKEEVFTRASIRSAKCSPETSSVAGDPVLQGEGNSAEQPSSDTSPSETNVNKNDVTDPKEDKKEEEVFTRAFIPSAERSPVTNSVAGDPVLQGEGNSEEQPSSDTSPSATNVDNNNASASSSSNDQTGQSSEVVVRDVLNTAMSFFPKSILNANPGQALNDSIKHTTAMFAERQKDLSASWVDID